MGKENQDLANQCSDIIKRQDKEALFNLFNKSMEELDFVGQGKEACENAVYIYTQFPKLELSFSENRLQLSRFEMIKFLALANPSLNDAIHLVEILKHRGTNVSLLWNMAELNKKSAQILLDLCFDRFQKFLLQDIKTVDDYLWACGIEKSFLFNFYRALDLQKTMFFGSFLPKDMLLKLASSFLRRGFGDIAERIIRSLEKPLQKQFQEENNWEPTLFSHNRQIADGLVGEFYGNSPG